MIETTQFIQDLAVIAIAAAVAAWVCKRAGLSPIVGFLLAGIAIGPHTPPHAFVFDVNRIHVLAQLGILFLMFGIGLGFSVRRLRQLGLGLMGAMVAMAFIIFNASRLVGTMIGLDDAGSVFFGGMLVVSSSAVIGKLLEESGRSHEKGNQLALGITLSEDIAAIVMLTLLGSYTQLGADQLDAGGPGVLTTVALLGGLVLVLVVCGLLVVPRMLKALARDANTELETLVVASLLLGLAVVIARAGYSLALGAFLLGAIISETRERVRVERSFAGLKDFFGAIFFVAIGMSIDVRLFPQAIGPIVAATLLAIVGRASAATFTLLVFGHDSRTAIRAGLMLTPVGEFSFIIAQMGTLAAVLPSEYLPVAVGTSLLTTLLAPVLLRYSSQISDGIARIRFRKTRALIGAYRQMLESVGTRRNSSLLWRLLKKRILQIGVEMALIASALAFGEPLIDAARELLAGRFLPEPAAGVVLWTVLGLVVLAPLIAVWRNIQAVTMIIADHLTTSTKDASRARPIVTASLQSLAAVGIALWLWNFVPIEHGVHLATAVLLVLVFVAVVFWRRLIRWHSSWEISLDASMSDNAAGDQTAYGWLDRYAPWGLSIGEVTLPDRFAHAAKTIGELGIRTRHGATVVGLERQSVTVANPGPDWSLFPGDRLLVLGTPQQITAAREGLLGQQDPTPAEDAFRDLALELVRIPAGSSAVGHSLASLHWSTQLGIQVVGHKRGRERTITPSAGRELCGNDEMLVIGTPAQVSRLRDAVSVIPETPAN